MNVRVRSILLLFLIFLGIGVLAFPSVPQAHAAGPTISHSTASNSCNGGGAGNTASFTCNMIVAAGDVIILSAGWLKGSVGAGTTFTPSDSATNTYVQIGTRSSQCGNPANDWCQSWMYDVASAATTGTITFTFTFGATGFIAGDLWDISGGSVTGLTFNTGTANGSPMQVSPFVSSGSISLAAYICDGCSGTTNTPETGFSLITNQPTGANNGFWQYAIQSTTAASTNEQCKITIGNLIAFAGVCVSFLGSAANCASGTTCTITGTVTVGNVEVVTIQWSTEATGVLTVTDTLGNTYKPVIPAIELTSCDSSGCINGHTVSTSIFDSAITVGGSTTITITMSASTTNIAAVLYSVANVNPTPICVAGYSTTSGVTSTVIATATSCASVTADTDIASIAGFGSFALTAGANFVLTQSSASGNFGAETGNINGNTVFPASIASATVVSEIGIVLGPTSATGTTGVGSCPNKNTATFTMVNSTQYFYTGTTLQNFVIGTMTAEVASVNSGHAASETLYFGIYSTVNAGAVSAGNPLLLAGFKTWTLSATSSPQQLIWAIGLPLNTVSGATWGISISGNSKILINQSSLAGLTTGASGPVVGTTGTLNGQFTSLSASGTELFMCGTANYQVVVTSVTTTTVTSTVTTTTGGTATTTSTITSTLSSIDANAAAGTTTGFTLILLVTLIPAVVLGGLLAITRSGPLTLGGFIAGLGIGAGAGNLAGIVPIQFLAIIVLAIVLLIVFGVMVMRGGGGGT